VIGYSIGKIRASVGTSYYPVAEYVGLDGLKRYVEGAVGSSSPLGAIGDSVTVLVHPDDPDKAVLKSSLTYAIDARIDRGRWNTAIPMLVAAGGALFLGAGLWVLKRQTT
jgi:Protein of unknown function (DUF3592)